MNIQLITIGDELLYGKTINTNAAFMAGRLADVGARVVSILTVGDRVDRIAEALRAAAGTVEVVLVTGGLGPTPDDVTRQAIARAFEIELVFDESLFADIERFWAHRGKPTPSSARMFSYIPEGADIMHNIVGTAAGLKMRREETVFYFLPGVPEEMRSMIEHCVLPDLRRQIKGQAIRHLTLRTSGSGESALARKLEGLDTICPDITLAYLPQTCEVHLRLTSAADSVEKAEQSLSEAERVVRDLLGYYIYGTEDQTLEAVVADLLFSGRLTLATAESCTGGLISGRLTDISGSSAFLKAGIVAYSRWAKENLLGVSGELIDSYGLVSHQTASAMAEGCRTISGTDIGLSVTGVMGPTGGTEKTPVGLAFIGLAHEGGSHSREYRFPGDRLVNRQLTAQAALNELRLFLLKKTAGN